MSVDAEKGLLEILTEIEKRGFTTGQDFFDTFDRLTKENEDHQFQNDCRSGSEVCACSEKNGYPCYRHIDHEYRKLFALNTATIDRAEKAEAERDRLLPVAAIAERLVGYSVVGHLTRCTCSKCKDFLTVYDALNHKEG